VTLARLWAFLAVALPVLGALLANLQSVDLAYHLRAGGLILDTRAIPTTDTFTFTAAGLAWQDQQWGGEVILAAVYRGAGWTGLVLLRATLVGLIFGFVFAACRRGNSNRTAALLTLAAFALASVTLALRPQLFGMALFGMMLWLVWRRGQKPAALWLVIPLTIAWANLHGSFVLAPLVLGLAALEDAITPANRGSAIRTLAVATACAFATLLNPFGVGLWEYAADIATNPTITNRITEWQPTTPFSVEGAAFYVSLALVGVLLAVTARRYRRLDPGPVVWLGPFVVIAIRSVRGLAWWPIVAAATVAKVVASPNESARRERLDSPLIRRLNTVIAGIIVLAGVGLLPLWRPLERGLDAPAGVVGTAPPGVTAALRDLATPADRLFAPQPWGSWFEFALPAVPVFIDSRIELFPTAVWDDYDAIVNGDARWSDAVDRWGITIIVTIDRVGQLTDRLRESAAWREVYNDADARVFVRADRSANSHLVPLARRDHRQVVTAGTTLVPFRHVRGS
jgi:hypothetical protein